MTWLIDKSALWRLHEHPVAADWAGRIERGLVWISAPTLLEVGYSAVNADHWKELLHAPPISLMPVAFLTPAVERRAVEVQGILARRGEHRAPSVADLLVAATGELHDLVVLHQDKDFDLIACITGQAVESLSAEG